MRRRFWTSLATVGVCGLAGLVSGAATASPTHAAGGFAASLHTTRLTAVSGKVEDNFGYAGVAVAGDIAAVSAVDRTVGTNSQQGLVYLFRRPASGWAHAKQVAVLKASDGGVEDLFGLGLAFDGATIVVDAPGHTVGTVSGAGAVYVFRKPASGWSGTLHESAELQPDPALTHGGWGQRSVAVSGRTIVVGASAATVGGNQNQGEALLYVEPKHGWSGVITHPTATLTASDGAASDALGYDSVGISGSTVVAGAGGHDGPAGADQGAVYVFERPSDGWSGIRHESAELTPSDAATGDEFGEFSAAISGRTVVAGSGYHAIGSSDYQGEAEVFVEPRSGWSGPRRESAILRASDGATDDYFGLGPVVISGDLVATEAPDHVVDGTNDAGAVYLYRMPSGGWSGTRLESAERVANDPQVDDQLGYGDLAISGTTVLAGTDDHDVGSNADQGAAYLFAPGRPVISALATSDRSLAPHPRAATINPRHPHKGGVRFSFSLDQDATVSLHFVRHRPGRHGTVGTVSLAAPAGRDNLYFYGRVGPHRTLKPGIYTVSIAAANTAGGSKPRTERLTVS